MSASDLSEYLNHGRYKDGHARCIKLLKKNPSDPYLLISKAFFLRRLDRPVEAEDVVQTLLDRGPAITDLEAVKGIENYRSEAAALSESRVMSLGPAVNRLWNNGISNLAKDRAKEWHEDRLSRAIQDRRWIDAGYVGNATPDTGCKTQVADATHRLCQAGGRSSPTIEICDHYMPLSTRSSPNGPSMTRKRPR